MSSHSSRPNVKSIDSAIIDTAVGGTILVGALIFAAIRCLKNSATGASSDLDTTKQGTSSVVQSAAAIETETDHTQDVRIQRSKAQALEAHRLASLINLGHQPYRISDVATIERQIQGVIHSKSSRELETSVQKLHRTVVEQHDHLFVNGIARTCELAMRKIGFNQVTNGLSSAGTMRIVGTDDMGRVLVSEITPQPGGSPLLESETVNVIDGSCNDILDQFDKDLEELGLRSGDPKRKTTGGLCQTATARAFIRFKFGQPVRKAVGQSNGDASAKGMRRRPTATVNTGRK